MAPLRILVTNDDGIEATGIRHLSQVLSPYGEVWVIAPSSERSGSSHAFTLKRPLRVVRLRERWYSIDGTPTDCVLIGYHGIMKKRIDFLFSGINAGANMGDDITYSGTVAAAWEGAILGIPSVALSLVSPFDNLEIAGLLSVELLEWMKKHRESFYKRFLNINIPPGPIKGIKITGLGHRIYKDKVIVERKNEDECYYSLDGELSFKPLKGTDFDATSKGYISITPLHWNFTDYEGIEMLKKMMDIKI